VAIALMMVIMMMKVVMVVTDGDDDGDVVERSIGRSIDVEESHSVGHMQTEYKIGRPTAWQNPRRHQHLRHKLPTLRPLQSRTRISQLST